MKGDAKIVGWFAAAGLLLPFSMFFFWRLSTQDYAVLSLTSFNALADILWPGARFAYIAAYSGPWDWGVVLGRFMKAELINGLIYAAVGVIVAIGARVAKHYRKQTPTET